jgi:serine/threonine-protein kinase RsbT
VSTVAQAVGGVLAHAISPITLRSITSRLGALGDQRARQLTDDDRARVLRHLDICLSLFAPARCAALLEECRRALAGSPLRGPAPAMGIAEAAPNGGPRRIEVRREDDIAYARIEALGEAARAGFSRFDSVKVATAVSELARNIIFYAGTGEIRLAVTRDGKGSPSIQIQAMDGGPGIPPERLQQALAGSYRSERGLGKGLLAVSRLADAFEVSSATGKGTTVRCEIKRAT